MKNCSNGILPNLSSSDAISNTSLIKNVLKNARHTKRSITAMF